MEKIIESILDALIKFSGKLFLAILIIAIGLKVIQFVMKKIQKGRSFSKLEKSSQTFISSIINIILKIIIIITAIATLGIPMTSIVAVISSAGLALGLALQGGLSNIAGGVMIMLFKPFKVGDYIATQNEEGTVKEINIFHTVLNTIDNKLIVLPNGNLSNSVIVNYSAMKDRILVLDICVDYKSNIDKVKEILHGISDNCQYKLNNKDTLIALKEHSDSALKFTFRMWVSQEKYWPARYEILEEIKKQFDKNKISIPYPQLDVHLDK